MNTLFSITPGDVPSGRNERDNGLLVLLREFDRYYPADADCVETLISMTDDGPNVICRYCFCNDISRSYGNRIGKCMTCNRPVRMTASTFFNGIRLPRTWLFLICLMEHGFSFNACELHRATGSSVSALSEMIKKISFVLYQYMVGQMDFVNQSSETFLPVFYKRSLETPVRAHPTAEQIQMELSHGDEADVDCMVSSCPPVPKDRQTVEFDLESPPTESEQAVLKLLSLTAVHIDELHERTNMPIEKLSAILMMLDLKGLVESNGGSRFALPSRNDSLIGMTSSFRSAPNRASVDPLPANLSAAICFIRTEFHGISRKYLQLYLALHWCSIDREVWCFGVLLKACRGFRCVLKSDIREFVTPLFVRLMPDTNRTGGLAA